MSYHKTTTFFWLLFTNRNLVESRFVLINHLIQATTNKRRRFGKHRLIHKTQYGLRAFNELAMCLPTYLMNTTIQWFYVFGTHRNHWLLLGQMEYCLIGRNWSFWCICVNDPYTTHQATYCHKSKLSCKYSSKYEHQDD